MKIDFSAIGKRIQCRRRQQKKTQDELAEALLVSVGYVSQIERGVTKISLETLAGIADFLGCSIGELADGTAPEQGDYLTRECRLAYDELDEPQRKLLLEIATLLSGWRPRMPKKDRHGT